MSSIVENAMDALQSGHKVQTRVREFIADSSLDQKSAACCLATDMGVFRQEAEGWIQTASDDVAVKDRRKKANNIINDVSRICREMTGYTIKCTSRKNHTYEATEPTPRSKTSPAPTPVVSSPIDMDALRDWCKSTPATTVKMLIDVHGAEKVGKMVADSIRAHLKDAEEKAA